MTPNGIFFRPDGRRVYFSDGSADNVRQYILTVAWDITTATWDTNFGTSIDSVEDVSFSSDGLKMYIVDGSAEDDIHEFELTVAWDISTASLSALYHINEDPVPNGVTFKPDGTKMYVIGNSNDSIYEYDLGIVCPHQVAIGHGGAPSPLALDVRSEDNNQIVAHDSSAQAAGVGGGIIFGGHYTDADDTALGGRIGVEKLDSVSGNFGFDMIFQSMPNGGNITEMLRLSAETDTVLVSSGLEVQTTTGALVIPKMTTTQRNALTAVNGMMVYNTSTNAFNKRENGAWASF
jgi:DNA-binding beta-propeller fold protein YncE